MANIHLKQPDFLISYQFRTIYLRNVSINSNQPIHIKLIFNRLEITDLGCFSKSSFGKIIIYEVIPIFFKKLKHFIPSTMNKKYVTQIIFLCSFHTFWFYFCRLTSRTWIFKIFLRIQPELLQNIVLQQLLLGLEKISVLVFFLLELLPNHWNQWNTNSCIHIRHVCILFTYYENTNSFVFIFWLFF